MEREDAGFVQSFRHIIRQLVNIFDHTHSEAQARIRLQQLRQDITTLEDRNLEKILIFFDDHWEQALRYLRKKGMGKHRRGSNSESGMRLLRRLEKNHDGLRSATTRQHYIQIYQAMKYLSLDIADFLEKGPQMAEHRVCKRWDTPEFPGSAGHSSPSASAAGLFPKRPDRRRAGSAKLTICRISPRPPLPKQRTGQSPHTRAQPHTPLDDLPAGRCLPESATPKSNPANYLIAFSQVAPMLGIFVAGDAILGTMVRAADQWFELD